MRALVVQGAAERTYGFPERPGAGRIDVFFLILADPAADDSTRNFALTQKGLCGLVRDCAGTCTGRKDS